MEHWADLLAEDIIAKKKGKKITIATGITPSGPIHLGNMREVLTGDAIFKALKRKKADCRLLYLADTFDPLRKVYPFLPSEFEKYVGMLLYEIPDPEGDCHANYADHYLKPFLQALEILGIHAEVILAHEFYRSGRLAGEIKTILINRDKVAEIISSVTGRKLEKDWWPFIARCHACGRISSTRVETFDESDNTVDYTCGFGHKGKAKIDEGGGKLPWRLDWPARWKALAVDVEPFGKDHAAAGGSYDTGVRISREILDNEPPAPQIYEWIYLKGKGAMASSTGVGVSISDLLSVIEPEKIRYLVLRSRPEKHLDFDPGQGLIQLSDDYNTLEESYFNKTADDWNRRVYELSQNNDVPKEPKPHIPLDHLAIAIQTGLYKTDEIINILKRTGYIFTESDLPFIYNLIEKTSNWLEKFAPSGLKFENPATVKPDIEKFSDEQIDFLKELSYQFDLWKTTPDKWTAEDIHTYIHSIAGDMHLSQKNAFQAIYLALINQKHGPRAGWFLASLERNFVVDRFNAIIKARRK